MIQLQPKSKLSRNVEENIIDIIKMTKYDQEEKIDKAEWDKFIRSYDGKIEIHHTVIFNNETDVPWMWSYCNNRYIELVIKNSRKADVHINEKEIKSPSICGTWWYPISDISINETKTDLIIKFIPKCQKTIPTLIGNCEEADSLSLLYLGIFCLRASNVNFYTSFLTISAKKGLIYARMHLWRYYYHINQIKKALYWLSILTIQNHSFQSALCLSQILIDPNSPIKNYSLSEHLLIQVIDKHKDKKINENNSDYNDNIYIDSMITLGKIYMLEDVEDAPHDIELGMKLLEIASTMMDIPEVQQAMNEYKVEKEKSLISPVDIAISTGITIVALCVVGFFMSRRKH